MTYIRVGKDWHYLCTVMDLYTRKVIGWHFGKKLNAGLIREALIMAVGDSLPKPGLIFHTDRGIEFCSKEVYRFLDELSIRNSKSRKDHCWDNAAMGSFFGTLKTEMVYFHKFQSLVEAVAHIMDFIRFYNYETGSLCRNGSMSVNFLRVMSDSKEQRLVFNLNTKAEFG